MFEILNIANINIVIRIESGLSHIHWPIFEDEKEESIEIIGYVNFHKKSRCDENYAPKREWEQISENNREFMLLFYAPDTWFRPPFWDLQ